MIKQKPMIALSRRAFIQNGTLVLAAASLCPRSLPAASSSRAVRIGLITDLHYADKPESGTRFYRETLDKLAEASQNFAKEKIDLVVELGDIIDAAQSVETELTYLKRINKEFSAICDERHYVLGNHCVDTLKKEEFLGEVGKDKSYYSFDRDGVHFIVLDACFRSDGKAYERKNFTWTDANIPDSEIDWLKEDLKQNSKPTIVFAHQRLDGSDSHCVKNSEAVRKLLESTGNVLAVFQGHSHQNDLKEINGIHYCTMVAMVEGSGAENNGFSIFEVSADSTIQVHGFRKQKKYDWADKSK